MSENKKNTHLTTRAMAKIDEWLTCYPAEQRRSALLPALHIVQEENNGWLPTECIEAVADYLQIPHIAAFEVATFYSMYELKPVGRHKICLCTNISCQLQGSDEIAAHLQQRLGIDVGETTADGKFTLRAVECLGACVGGPMMQLGHQYYEHLTPERIDEILDGLE